ncbi:hypothetical protein XELAEV_18038611mg [Xenopus laevis]|uniref:Uncharacterized protein n=1 Tax=Xenopus laevis TaxID=8355 RepID=A0A974C6H2_XENLA|nr:hypothetical protein XELAEV_18038611mg [Xenopus laevis]
MLGVQVYPSLGGRQGKWELSLEPDAASSNGYLISLLLKCKRQNDIFLLCENCQTNTCLVLQRVNMPYSGLLIVTPLPWVPTQ